MCNFFFVFAKLAIENNYFVGYTGSDLIIKGVLRTESSIGLSFVVVEVPSIESSNNSLKSIGSHVASSDPDTNGSAGSV